jgi:hypothetical protein
MLEDAETLYKKKLSVHPNNMETNHLLGGASLRQSCKSD